MHTKEDKGDTTDISLLFVSRRYLFQHLFIPYSGKVLRINSCQEFGERKFSELIDQPIGYKLYISTN